MQRTALARQDFTSTQARTALASSSSVLASSIWSTSPTDPRQSLSSLLRRSRTEVETITLGNPLHSSTNSSLGNAPSHTAWNRSQDQPLDHSKQAALASFFGLSKPRARANSVPPPLQLSVSPIKSTNTLFEVLEAATSGERSRPPVQGRIPSTFNHINGHSYPSEHHSSSRSPHKSDAQFLSEEAFIRARLSRSMAAEKDSRLAGLSTSPSYTTARSGGSTHPVTASSIPTQSYLYDNEQITSSSLPSDHSFEWRDRESDEYEPRGRTSPTQDWSRPNPAYGTDAYERGIASTNVSPFTRDGARLPPAAHYVPRREHSLGPVGSGRRRAADPAWDGVSRSLVFAETADDGSEDDHLMPPNRSGATSRRHSMATVPGRSQVGFSAPVPLSATFSSSLKGLYEEPSAKIQTQSASINNLRFSDDDLADSLNSLQMSMEQRPTEQLNVGANPFTRRINSYEHPSPIGQASGLNAARPTFAPTNLPYSTSPNNQNQLPPSSNFFAPPPQQRTTSFAYGTASNLSANAQPFGGNNPAQSAIDPALRPVYFGAQTHQEPDLAEFGRGIPLHQVPNGSLLYIVEFKGGRTDIFYCGDTALPVQNGDVVIVEADRGKDLGTIVHDNISLQDVQAFQKHQVEQALGQLAGSQTSRGGVHLPNQQTIARLTREVHPKRILSKATPTDLQLLLSKAADESKALALCRGKVLQKNLEMEITDAEWQFDRRKLTLFYIAEKRIDFRELVRELFRLYKTRIWLAPVERKADSMISQGRF